MKSRFCEEFEYQKQYYFDQTFPIEQIKNNIVFSVEVWPPFINLFNLKKNSSTIICGPLLGYLIELSYKLKSNLTYIPDLENNTLPFAGFDEYGINLILTPFTPMNKFDEFVQEHIHLSRIVNDVPMLSILSGKKKLKINWSVFNSFNVSFVHLNIIFFLFIGYCMLISNWMIIGSWKLKIIYDMIRCLLTQPIQRLHHEKIIRYFMLNLLWLSFFLKLFLSYTLLALNQFGQAHDKIDSLNDLVRHRNMEIFLFEGEPSQTILTDSDHPLYADLKDRLLIQDPPNESIEEWEIQIANEINERKIAMISDQYYLDHLYNTFINEFPNLYRSKQNAVIQPYYLPLSNNNSNKMDESFNEMIRILSENGLYNYWVLETFYHAEMETQKKMKKFKRNDDERSSHKHSMDDFQTKSLSINDIQAIIYIYYIFSINSLNNDDDDDNE
ncbi:hypothetical protein DERP_001624 [Dermatophagoides pteronyssinus]|uniref:Uncharacterized protein n=1 Tax=Dermatophagoides pteronyssinus TaxID=6956 RepID=A0ABQ8JBM8_DERPT|nr:hypothetical protein DERP_001624 [Dermatophagoides pteronyssinus]